MQISRLGLTHASVFKKCLVLMAGATILVATVLSVLNIRSNNARSTTGIRDSGRGCDCLSRGGQRGRLALWQCRRIGGGAGARTRHVRRRGPARHGTQCSGRDPGRPRRPKRMRHPRYRPWRGGDAFRRSTDGAGRVPAGRSQFRGLGQRPPVGAVAIAWTPRSAVPPPGPSLRANLAVSALLLVVLLFGAGRLVRASSSRSPLRCSPKKSRPSRRPLRRRGAVHRSRGRDRDDRAQPVGPSDAACRRRPRRGSTGPHRTGAETRRRAAGRRACKPSLAAI
jgi:hypothetical protein